MATRDLLIAHLYNTPREPQVLALVIKHAPIILFDEREPFMPLAAGYTIFNEDGPSASFERSVVLCPPDKEPAVRAIEYAIWWDWDIHHLYELEHLWVYLDLKDRPVRVEASWHGGYHELPVLLEGTHPVLLSEPGKHAFASDSSRFQRRVKDFRRLDTLYPTLPAEVLVKSMFENTIRKRIFDNTLVRSYLVHQAFEPAWKFSQRFTFDDNSLVPWPALSDWIPQRVHAWLARLEASILPADYHALRLISMDGSLEGLQTVARTGAEAVFFPVCLRDDRLVFNGPSSSPLELKTAYAYCSAEPMCLLVQPEDLPTVEQMSSAMRSNRALGLTLFTSPNVAWLKRYKTLVPQGQIAIQLTDPAQDPILAAEVSGAQYIQLRWENFDHPRSHLTAEWVQRVHNAGLGIIAWPVDTENELDELRRSAVDVTWQNMFCQVADKQDGAN